jgi:hypothetical protein
MPRKTCFKRNLTHIKALFILLGILILGIPGSKSYFSNKETSKQNKLESTDLDIELAAEENFDPDQEISPGETQSKDFTVINLGQDGFPYKLRTDNISGDMDLCDVLEVNLIFHDESSSSGNTPLDTLDFSISAINGNDSYTLEVTLPAEEDDPELGNSSCSFDLAADIWIEDLNPGQAYYDTESFENHITTSSLKAPPMFLQLNDLQVIQETSQSTESE